MALKKFKHLISAALSAALAITACVTTVQGENSPLAGKISQELYSNSQTITGEIGSINNVVRNPVSVLGLTGSFSGTSYYEQIDEDSQKIYNGIYKEYKDGMRNGEKIDLIEYFPEMKFEVTGTVSNGYFSPDEGSKKKMNSAVMGYLFPAYLALFTDHPELSWISYCYFGFNYNSTSITSTGNGTYMYPVTSVTFVLTADNIYGTPKEITDAVSKAKGVIGTQETMYEQVKAIHDYLCNTIDYNYTALESESELPAGYDIGYYQTAYSAFYRIPQDDNTELGKSTDKNLTVCAGYARSFKILCDAYSIPCVYVVGDGVNNSGQGEAHAWNYVKMDDDKWYGVDTTWDDQTKIYYNYFLAGADTPGFNTLTFGQSHKESGIWTSDTTFVFQYPTLAKEAYEPNNVPEDTTAETTPAPVITTEETTPAPVITTEETTPAPVITTEETTPAPVITTEETTPAPVITTEETTPAPVITTEETTPAPVITTEETTPAPVITTEETTPAPVITTEETTPAPVITTEETTPAPVVTTEETTPAPVVTTEETTPAPVVTTEETTPEPVVTTAEETAAPEPVVTTEASTTAPEEQGNLDSNVNTGEGAPEVDIDMDKDQLIDAVLSDEEKELLKDGEISIDFNIENTDKTVSDEIKKAVEDFLSKLSQGDYSLGMYLDISLSKTVNGEKSAVTSTNKAIRITVSIPENLQKDNRSFGMVRVHDGKAEFLEDLDTDPNTITIETDKFSDYAVVYSDKKTADPEPGKDEDKNQNTGFGFENSLIITMIISCAAVLASAVTIYVKSSKSKK